MAAMHAVSCCGKHDLLNWQHGAAADVEIETQ